MTDLREFDAKVKDTDTTLTNSQKLFTSCIQDAEGEVGGGLTAMQTLLKSVHQGISASLPDFEELMTEMEGCSESETLDLQPKMRWLADKAGAALSDLESAEQKSEKALRLVMTYHSRFSSLSQDIMAQQQGIEARAMEATKMKAVADAALVGAEASLGYAQAELVKADQAVQEHQEKIAKLQSEVNGKQFASLGVGATQVVSEEVAKASKKHVWFGGGVAVLGSALLPVSFGLSSSLIAVGASYATGSAIVHVGATSASEATQKKYDELKSEIAQLETKLDGLRAEQSRKQVSLWTSQTKVNVCKHEKAERGREIEHLHGLQSYITQMHRSAGVTVDSAQSYEDGMQVLKHALDGCTYALSEKVILLKDGMEERPRLRKVNKRKEFMQDQRAILGVINTLCSTAQAVQGLLERTEVRYLFSRQ